MYGEKNAVSPHSRQFRALLTVVVCVLILGVVFLGAQAKAGQYDFQSTFTSYLAKSTKMSDSGVQRVAPPPSPRGELLCAPEIAETLSPGPVCPVALPALTFLRPLRFRPPPRA